jgi:hypothetical protein
MPKYNTATDKWLTPFTHLAIGVLINLGKNVEKSGLRRLIGKVDDSLIFPVG